MMKVKVERHKKGASSRAKLEQDAQRQVGDFGHGQQVSHFFIKMQQALNIWTTPISSTVNS